ncbi:MAG: YggT family protein [Sporolactobacillus sp.]
MSVKQKQGGMLPKLVSILLVFIQIIVALSILLHFFNANPTPFVILLNHLAEPLLRPFANIFHPIVFGMNTLDLSAVFALIVYSVIGFGLRRLFALLKL